MKLDIEHWKQFKLGKVLSIKNGRGITKEEISQYEGDFPAVQSGESNNGVHREGVCIFSYTVPYCCS